MTSLGRQNWRRLGFLSLVLTLAVCSGGCLSFEKQTLVLFFPKDGKEIQGLFIYEGLMVQGQTDKQQANDLLKAIEDLEELVRGDAIIFVERAIRLPLKPRPQENVKQEFLDLYKPYVTAHKGQFLMGDNGKLTYCQPVTLRDPQKFMAGINKAISASIVEGRGGANAEHYAMLKKFAGDGHPWLRFDKGRLSAHVPGTPAIFQQIRKSFVDSINLDEILQRLDNLEKPHADAKAGIAELRRQANDAQAWLAAVGQTPLSVEQRHDMLIFALGYGNNESFSVLSPSRHRAQLPNLDKDLKIHARTLGVPVRTDVTVENVVMEFQRSGRFPRQREE